MNEKKLLELKERIQKAKEEKAELNGRMTQLLTELKSKFGYDSIDKAKEGLKKITEAIDKTQSKLDEKIKEIQTEYNID